MQWEGCPELISPAFYSLPALGQGIYFLLTAFIPLLQDGINKTPNWTRTLWEQTGPGSTSGSPFSCSQGKCERSYIFGFILIYTLTPCNTPHGLNGIDSLLLLYNLENNSNNSNTCGLAKCFIIVKHTIHRGEPTVIFYLSHQSKIPL